MSENQKFLNLIRGGGQQFSKMSEIQKSLKFPMGGGVKPIWELFPNFSVFFYDGSPNIENCERLVIENYS